MTLDPAGLEAAQLEWTTYNLDDPAAWREAVTAAVRAYLAAVPAPTTENPYADPERPRTWARGAEVQFKAWREGFAAGRAAATPDPPPTDPHDSAPWDDDWQEQEAMIGTALPAAFPDERLREALRGIGMSSLDAIIERLREQACGPDEYRHWNYVEAVTVEQAEAAVLAAVDARTDERERLSARVYENGWCPTCGTKTADPGVIPGPDPGACPACGGWRKAGMIHRCPPGATPEDERARIGAEERKRITDLLRDGAARRELRANRPGNAAATTLMASWEALRLAADVIERSAGSAGSDGEDR